MSPSHGQKRKAQYGKQNNIYYAAFALDALLIVVAVALFVTKPACERGSEPGLDVQSADFLFPGQYPETFEGHQTPTFNQFAGSSSSNTWSNFDSFRPWTSEQYGNSGSSDNNYGSAPAPPIELIPEDTVSSNAYACGIPSVTPNTRSKGRIVGGSVVHAQYSWPWSASVGQTETQSPYGKNVHLCGGALLSSRHVLTAAHCFSGDSTFSKKYSVFLGHMDRIRFPGAKIFEVVKIRTHPLTNAVETSGLPEYDFALLTLKTEVQIGREMLPTCLPSVNHVLPAKTKCWAVGYGETMGTGGDLLLKQVKIDLVSEATCQQRYGTTKEIELCAGTVFGQDTCAGDSGAPLTCKVGNKWILYGVMSHGPRICGQELPAAYASVSFHVSWLCCYMKELQECASVECNPSGKPNSAAVSTSSQYSPWYQPTTSPPTNTPAMIGGVFGGQNFYTTTQSPHGSVNWYENANLYPSSWNTGNSPSGGGSPSGDWDSWSGGNTPSGGTTTQSPQGSVNWYENANLYPSSSGNWNSGNSPSGAASPSGDWNSWSGGNTPSGGSTSFGDWSGWNEGGSPPGGGNSWPESGTSSAGGGGVSPEGSSTGDWGSPSVTTSFGEVTSVGSGSVSSGGSFGGGITTGFGEPPFGEVTSFGSGTTSFGTSIGGGIVTGSGASTSLGPSIAASKYPHTDLVEIIPEDRFQLYDYKCGVQDVKPNLLAGQMGRIVRGSVATPHSWPWVVSLRRTHAQFNVALHICAGTIVSPRHVISAAHCTVDEIGEFAPGMDVDIGKHGKKVTARLYKVKKIRIPPHKYDESNLYYDLSLLTLAEEIQFSDKVQMACLPKQDVDVPLGTHCWSYGWGRTNFTGGKDQLKQVDMVITELVKCEKVFGKRIGQEWSVCGQTKKGEDTCQGDSGGPVTCQQNGKWVLEAAVSFGFGCGLGYPGVYAGISHSMVWFCCFLADLPACEGIPCEPNNSVDVLKSHDLI